LDFELEVTLRVIARYVIDRFVIAKPEGLKQSPVIARSVIASEAKQQSNPLHVVTSQIASALRASQ
jgi:hypothetical protein